MEIVFNSEECNAIIEFSKTLTEVDSLTLYRPGTTRYSYRVLPQMPPSRWIFDRFYKFFEKETGHRIKIPIQEVYIHNFKSGTFFKKHKDQPDKYFSFGLCLNDDYEGGEFVLYNPYEILLKKQGVMYVFESDREHEILPITSGERWSIIGFIEKGHLGLSVPSKLM